MRVRTSVAAAAAAALALVATAGLAAAQPQPPPPLPPLPPPLVAAPEPAPPGTPYRVGYVSTAEAGPAAAPDAAEPADVWSADETGGDRRNHTARPGLRDDGPAYSPDGARLAYSAQDGGGARIVVADADGRDGRVLAPPGTVAADLDQDPTWSPDGTMIAFTRQQEGIDGEPTSRILIVRAADGQQLGQVPMPAYLVGRDLAPAWSPDGTRIAFARAASRRPPPVADPPTVDVPVMPGGELEVPVSVLVPEVPARPDIVFLIDASLSMQPAIDDVAANVETIVDTVRTDQPTARFGLAYYRDGGIPADLAAGAEFFDVLQPLTEDQAALAAALGDLTVAGGGADGPEDWIYPLHQLATGTPDLPEERRIEFVPGRTPIVVLIGDASSKEPSVAPGTAHRLTDGDTDGDTMLALLAVGVRVVAVDVDTGTPFADGLNGDRTNPFLLPPVPGQGTLVAERTGGVFVPPGEGADAVSAAIIAGLLGIPVPVEAQVEACDPGLAVTVAPPSQAVQGGATADFTVTVAVASGAPGGATLRCLIGYALGDGSRVVQEIVVRVGDGVSPRVRVDDLIVETTDPTGAAVDYPAAAVTASGDPLTPACVPPAGSRFPVGTTVVTCTATDGAGNTGSDTALVSVVLGPADGLTRVWLATLAFPAADAGIGADAVVVTDQVDFSATVGPGCTAGDHDTEPAWSPDARSLVFADVADSPSLCMVDVTAGTARALVGRVDGGVVRDPAWSIDGTFVAFGVDRSSALGRDAIWTVPVAGPATAEALIVGSGHQSQPAFRRLPAPVPAPAAALALTVTVAPAPGFVGGDDLVVRYTIRNDTTVALGGVALTAGLPDALPATAATSGCTSPTSCALGVVPAGATVEVLVRLAPEVAVEDVATGRVTASTVDGPPASASGSAAVVVREPVLEISPELGPPGLVAQASGTDFPPGAQVRLVWRDGITATDDTVTVAPDGTFTWPALVFRKDALGPRELHAEPVAGPSFRPATVEFLVVPRTQQPPLFEGRG